MILTLNYAVNKILRKMTQAKHGGEIAPLITKAEKFVEEYDFTQWEKQKEKEADTYQINEDIPLIFLDIDGVLNSGEFFKSDRCKAKEIDYTVESEGKLTDELFYQYRKAYFDPLLIDNLNYILDETGADIILSSSWRIANYDIIPRIFKELGVRGKIVSKTPSLNSIRGIEIYNWINSHWDNNKEGDYKSWQNFLRYVILDDSTDMMYNQTKNFVNTNNRFGLTRKDAEKAIRILKQEANDFFFEDVILQP